MTHRLKLLLCPQHSVNNQVYLWVTSAPECNYNVSIMLRDEQIKRLIENYNISFTVDLKAASYCGGLMLGRHPCIWCTWDKRSGLSRIEWKPQSSSHHLEMLIKLCDQYQGDGVGVVSEQGAESIYWRAPRSGRILSYKGNPYPYLHGRYLERTVLFSIIFLDTFSSSTLCHFCTVIFAFVFFYKRLIMPL